MSRSTHRSRSSNRPCGRTVAVVAVVAAAIALALSSVVAAGAQGTSSPDRLTVTDGTRTMKATKTSGLNPAGETVTVTGSGYTPSKGIYVALCVVPAPNQSPTPCGGGEDRAGASGSSLWISDNPPQYGDGLATPYGPDGSFSATVAINAMLNPTTDCRVVACAIVTRNDHTRSTDRSQDLILPVTFGAKATPTTSAPSTTTSSTTSTTAAPTTATTAPIDQPLPPPDAKLSDDGLSSSDGVRTLRVTKAKDVAVDGEPVSITGNGYDSGKSIEVAFCAVPPVGEKPARCASSAVSAGPAKAAARVVASNDPAPTSTTAPALASQPYTDGGAFELTIFVQPMIDDATDCRTVSCAIVTSNDAARPSDRSQDLFVPVSFRAPPGTTETTRVAPQPTPTELATPTPAASSGGGSAPVLLHAVVAVVLAAAVGTGAVLWRRRKTVA